MTNRTRDIYGLIGFLALCLSVAAIGGMVTQTSVRDWYQQIPKPAFTPPDWVFAPTWTLLYVLMALAAWIVWRRRDRPSIKLPMAAFGSQLLLNLAWSFIFFGTKSVGWALIEIVFLWAAIATTLVLFWRVNRIAGWLFVPYLSWVSYAVALNASIYMLS